MNLLRFIENPNIPHGKVAKMLVGGRYADRLAAPLERLGIEVLWLDDQAGIDRRVAGHADLMAHHIGDSDWIATESAVKALKSIENIHIIDAEVRLSERYPGDVAMNVLRIGRYAFCRKDAVCSKILEHLCGREVTFVDVRQGYAKCAVCVVSKRAAITADAGLASVMRQVGIDVLEIEPGGVALDGYDYGFIGGAAVLIAPDTLALTGRLDAHPSAKQIRAFLTLRDIRTIELTDEPLFDVGSMLPLLEQK